MRTLLNAVNATLAFVFLAAARMPLAGEILQSEANNGNLLMQDVPPTFVYRPAGAGPAPVVISIHGGPEGQAGPYFNSTYQMWLDRLGVAVIVPNVRGSAGYGKSYLALDNGMQREDSEAVVLFFQHHLLGGG